MQRQGFFESLALLFLVDAWNEPQRTRRTQREEGDGIRTVNPQVGRAQPESRKVQFSHPYQALAQAQGALAWIWERSPVTIPIPGIRTVAQAEENVGRCASGR